MHTIVISDVHLGSKHCLCEQFLEFMRCIPAGSTLVLNGDTVNRRHKHLSGAHLEVLDLLKRESFSRRVIWLPGNHDRHYRFDDSGNIEFRTSYSIGKSLLVAHGHSFESVMSYNKAFITLFRAMHYLRVCLGAESAHVAFYAKRWPRLYRFLRQNVTMNAAKYAK